MANRRLEIYAGETMSYTVMNPKNKELTLICKVCGKEIENHKNLVKGHEKCIDYDFEGSSLEVDFYFSIKDIKISKETIKLLRCSHAGRYGFCRTCCHSIPHEEIIDDKIKIDCKKLSCSDGYNIIKVKCRKVKT